MPSSVPPIRDPTAEHSLLKKVTEPQLKRFKHASRAFTSITGNSGTDIILNYSLSQFPNKFTTVNITRPMLDSLEKNHDINGSVIDFVAVAVMELKKDVIIMQAQQARLFETRMNEGEKQTERLKERYCRAMNTYSFMAIPFHVRHSQSDNGDKSGHWVLFVISARDRKVYLADSLNTIHTLSHAFFERIINVCGLVDYELEMYDVAHQGNTRECGIYTILNLYSFVFGIPMVGTLTAEQIETVRTNLYVSLYSAYVRRNPGAALGY